MILNAIISFFVSIIQWIVGLLPNADSSIVSYISSSTASFRSAMVSINWFFPTDTALQVFSIIFIIQGGVLLFKIVKYIGGALTGGALK
jgi:hypothetical protein